MCDEYSFAQLAITIFQQMCNKLLEAFEKWFTVDGMALAFQFHYQRMAKLINNHFIPPFVFLQENGQA